MAYGITVNDIRYKVDVEGDTPLLWVLRDTLGLTGTKYGCGVSSCGACTVHVNGVAVRSCSLPIEYVDGAVTTIEGLSENGDHPLQTAWIEHQVPQCGYCQSGMIMAIAAFLKEKPDANEDELNEAVSNVCRCGTYVRIREAVKTAQQA